MASITISDEEFSQNPDKAREASARGPVFITDNSQPAYVLLNIDDFDRLRDASKSIVELLSPEGAEGAEFEPPRLLASSMRPPDFQSD